MTSTDPTRTTEGGSPLPQPGTRRVRLAILDDHEVLLDSLSSWIAVNAFDFDLALTAHTWLEMVHSENFPTDLVFLDFQLKERCRSRRGCAPAGPRARR